MIRLPYLDEEVPMSDDRVVIIEYGASEIVPAECTVFVWAICDDGVFNN